MMLALPPVALSVEHVGDILGALVPLVPHTDPRVRLSVLETVRTVLFCLSDPGLQPVVKDGQLANVVLDLTEHHNNETSIALVQATLDILAVIGTRSNVPRLITFLRSVAKIRLTDCST
jgi:hypothetical protein